MEEILTFFDFGNFLRDSVAVLQPNTLPKLVASLHIDLLRGLKNLQLVSHWQRIGYTLSFYRGSQDGKTIRFTWKSYRSHSWGKRETGLPDQKMNVNHLHGSSLKEHVQYGSWKTETKNAYVEVT